MRLTILGAASSLGAAVVDEALDRGHDVTILMEDRGQVKARHKRVKVKQASLFDVSTMCSCVEGSDAVISCIGTDANSWFGHLNGAFILGYAGALVTAMRQMLVTRLITITSWNTRDHVGHICRPSAEYAAPATEVMWLLERYLEEQCDDIDHTAVGFLYAASSPSTGQPILAVEGQSVPGTTGSIPRSDIAAFIVVNCAENGEWKKTKVCIGQRR